MDAGMREDDEPVSSTGQDRGDGRDTGGRGEDDTGWPAGRWFVVAALVLGVLFFLHQLMFDSARIYNAFLKGVGASAALMVLLGLAQRLWEGKRLQGAQLPGGAGAQFEPAEAAAKTREGVESLNTRVTTQSEQMITMQAQLDKRVSDLEGVVFKDKSHQGENDA